MTDIGPECHGTFGERPLGIAEQRRRIRSGLRPQSLAGRAPAEWAVKRKTVRRELLETATTSIASQMLAVPHRLPLGFGHVTAARARPAALPYPVPGRFPPTRQFAIVSLFLTTTRSITTSTRCLRRRSISRSVIDAAGLPVDANPQVSVGFDVLSTTTRSPVPPPPRPGRAGRVVSPWSTSITLATISSTV